MNICPRRICFEIIKHGQRIHHLVKHSSKSSMFSPIPDRAVREAVDTMIWCQKKSPHNKPRGGWVESGKIKKDGGEDHRQLNPVVLKDGGQRCRRLRNARPDPLRKVYAEERLKSCSCTHWGNREDGMCINCVPLIMAAVSSSST